MAWVKARLAPVDEMLWKEDEEECVVSCDIFVDLPDDMDAASSNSSDERGLEGVRFFPPVYLQRYEWAFNKVAEDESISTVLDLGCGEGKLLQRLTSKTIGLSRLIGVDTDPPSLLEATRRVKPEPGYLETGGLDRALSIDIFHGSGCDFDERVLGVDCICMIEVIEHMFKTQLPALVNNVFSQIAPRLVLITTPNSDFNPAFGPDRKEGFRHDDHKFEFSRKEFDDWCNGIITAYPQYTWSREGLGVLPEQLDALGHCTQCAVFTRSEARGESSAQLTTQRGWKLVRNFYFPSNQELDRRRYMIHRAANDYALGVWHDSPPAVAGNWEGVWVPIEPIANMPKMTELLADVDEIASVLMDENWYVDRGMAFFKVSEIQFDALEDEMEEMALGASSFEGNQGG